MRKKMAYAVFSLTNSGLDYMVMGNFGADKAKAEKWAEDHKEDTELCGHSTTCAGDLWLKYRHGLFVKKVKY